jgi:hypothetical protein
MKEKLSTVFFPIRLKVALLFGAALVVSVALRLSCAIYFLSTRPSVMRPDEGRTVPFHFYRFVVYLTAPEHLLVRLSFWLPFGVVVTALILRSLFDSDRKLHK